MKLKMAIPKGKLQVEVLRLLQDTGVRVSGDDRNYRPQCSDPRLQIKLLKSQNIPALVALGQHDMGFAGRDWIEESGADVVELIDLGFNPVRIVACIPEDWDVEDLRQRPIIVASEYRNLSSRFLTEGGYDFQLLRSFGATEVFPPEDADMVIDNTSTGSTIRANRLKIIATLKRSATCLIANRAALEDAEKKACVDELCVLIKGVMNGRERILLEMNCAPEALDQVVSLLPAMRAPTVAQLHRSNAFSVRAAVPSSAVSALIPQLLACGASDILEVPINKIL